jgi:DNA-binding PadR family transcriptional regulator
LAHFSDSPGSIYPALRRLERQGLVTATSGSRTLRPKQVYHLTDAGRAELRRWVGLAVTRDEVVGRDGVKLRFVFVAQILGPGAGASFLRELERVLADYIPELQTFYDVSAVAMPPGARWALKGGIDQYRAQLRWAREGIDQFGRLAADETA